MVSIFLLNISIISYVSYRCMSHNVHIATSLSGIIQAFILNVKSQIKHAFLKHCQRPSSFLHSVFFLSLLESGLLAKETSVTSKCQLTMTKMKAPGAIVRSLKGVVWLLVTIKNMKSNAFIWYAWKCQKHLPENGCAPHVIQR